MDEYRETLVGLVLPLTLGVVGGSVRAIRFGVKSWRQFAGSLIVACFVAVLANWLLEAAPELPQGVKSGIIGICAYSGGSVLDSLHAKFMRKLEKEGD